MGSVAWPVHSQDDQVTWKQVTWAYVWPSGAGLAGRSLGSVSDWVPCLGGLLTSSDPELGSKMWDSQPLRQHFKEHGFPGDLASGSLEMPLHAGFPTCSGVVQC